MQTRTEKITQKLAIHDRSCADAETSTPQPLASYAPQTGGISRMPNEIFSEIFYILRALVGDRWVRILQVGHHWRTVAQQLPYLWTRICCHQSPTVIADMIAYSRGRPLEVEISPRRNTDLTAFVLAVRPVGMRVSPRFQPFTSGSAILESRAPSLPYFQCKRSHWSWIVASLQPSSVSTYILSFNHFASPTSTSTHTTKWRVKFP